MKTKIKLTKDQRKALKDYNYAVSQEDRYLGSVFVNSFGQREHEEKVRVKYNICLSLGMNYQHGL